MQTKKLNSFTKLNKTLIFFASEPSQILINCLTFNQVQKTNFKVKLYIVDIFYYFANFILKNNVYFFNTF